MQAVEARDDKRNRSVVYKTKKQINETITIIHQVCTAVFC